MFKIGEFSRLTQVSVRMLRYYDETGLLKPEEIDPDSGYRLYSAGQIPVLNKIIFLRDAGFNVTEISSLLQNWDDKFVAGKLRDKELAIQQNIKAEHAKLQKIRLAEENIFRQNNEMHYQISIKSIPSYPVLSLRRVIPDYYAEGDLWTELSGFAKKHRLPVTGSTFSIYHDSEYKEKDVDVELCALVETTGKIRDGFGFTYRNTEPVPKMACTMVYGEFSHIAGAYLSFAEWLQKNSGYKMTGPSRQIVHRGPWNEKEPSQYLTEIQIPLEII